MHTVARGTGPRDRSTCAKNARQPKPFSSRPRHGEGQALALRYAARFFHRSAGACPPRSPDLREKRTPTKTVFLSIGARRGTGPRPTVIGTFFHRSVGACPPRSLAGPGDRSSGAPAPERVKSRRSCPTEGMRARVPDAWRGKPSRMRVWHARALALRYNTAVSRTGRMDSGWKKNLLAKKKAM